MDEFYDCLEKDDFYRCVNEEDNLAYNVIELFAKELGVNKVDVEAWVEEIQEADKERDEEEMWNAAISIIKEVKPSQDFAWLKTVAVFYRLLALYQEIRYESALAATREILEKINGTDRRLVFHGDDSPNHSTNSIEIDGHTYYRTEYRSMKHTVTPPITIWVGEPGAQTIADDQAETMILMVEHDENNLAVEGMNKTLRKVSKEIALLIKENEALKEKLEKQI